MFRIITDELRALQTRLKAWLTFVPFFRALSLQAPQEQYFLRAGVDGGRRLKASTIKARQRGYGYYGRNAPRSGATASGPYGVWSGRTLRHTWEDLGRKSVRRGEMTISHDLKRRITNYWDMKLLEKHLVAEGERSLQGALDGRTRRGAA